MGYVEQVERQREKLHHIQQMAKDLLSTYTFKMGAVLDSNNRVVHHVNSAQLVQLQRALDG